LLGLMSAGAWTCKASAIFYDDYGFYYLCNHLTPYGDQEVYSVDVYAYIGADVQYISSGLIFYDSTTRVVIITVFPNNSTYSYSMVSDFTGGWPTIACWCNENLVTGNTWLNILQYD